METLQLILYNPNSQLSEWVHLSLKLKWKNYIWKEHVKLWAEFQKIIVRVLNTEKSFVFWNIWGNIRQSK